MTDANLIAARSRTGRPTAPGRRQANRAILNAKTVPLDAMLTILHNDFVAYQEAYAQVRKGQPDPEAAENALTVMLAARDKALDSATKAAVYVHPRLTSVDYAGQTEARLTVIRVPNVAENAEEWQQNNAPVLQLVPAGRPVTWAPAPVKTANGGES